MNLILSHRIREKPVFPYKGKACLTSKGLPLPCTLAVLPHICSGHHALNVPLFLSLQNITPILQLKEIYSWVNGLK